MKTFGYLLMAVMACMTCSCRDEEPLPAPVPPVVEPENPGNPEEPDTGKVYLGIAPIIENMQEHIRVCVKIRGIITCTMLHCRKQEN